MRIIDAEYVERFIDGVYDKFLHDISVKVSESVGYPVEVRGTGIVVDPMTFIPRRGLFLKIDHKYEFFDTQLDVERLQDALSMTGTYEEYTNELINALVAEMATSKLGKSSIH